MRTHKNLAFIKFLVVFGETILINLCFFMSYFLHKDTLSFTYFIEQKNFLLYYNLTYFISISLLGIILHKRMVTIEEILDNVLKQTLLHFILILPLIIITNRLSEFSFIFILTLCISEFLFCITWRISFRKLLEFVRTRKKYLRPVIILGGGTIAYELYSNIIENKTNGYKLLGVFDDKKTSEEAIDKELIIGNLQEAIPFLEKNNVEEIFCALPLADDKKALNILTYAENNLIRFYFVPDFKKYLSKKVSLQFFNNIPIASLRSEPLDSIINSGIKRIFDLIFSTVFIVTVFPILLLFISVGIKLSSKGPIFFLQKRTGKDGQTFTCIKFRSMQVNDQAHEKQATKGDDRITKIGVFLRKTNLDETPQFINVLLGEMTIVGPRPHMVKHTAQYGKLIDKYMLRHLAKPGITGWAQVSGLRGETKNVREMEKRVIRDVWYLENWTFGLDLKIMVRTIFVMLKGDKIAF